MKAREMKSRNFPRRAGRIAARLAIFAAACLPTPVPAETIYVSNEKDNTVTVVDGETLQVTATVPVGERPRGIALSRDGRHLYICASEDDTMEILDTETLQVTGQLPSGPDPELLVVSPDGKRIYVANEDDNLVTVVDVETRGVLAEIPVGVEPEGMAVSHDGRLVVNTSETTNMAHFINAETGEITDNVLVDSRPRFAQFTSDDEEVWVSAEIGGSVAVIDNATRKIKRKIRFEIAGVRPESVQPVGVRILHDRSLAFVALGPANRVAVVDARTFEVKKYILVGQRVWQLAFSPDQSRIYSTNGNSNDISVIDVESLTVVKSIAVGRLPWGVASKE